MTRKTKVLGLIELRFYWAETDDKSICKTFGASDGGKYAE